MISLVFFNGTLWYQVVADAITTRLLAARYARAKAGIDRMTGAVFAGLGLRLVLEREWITRLPRRLTNRAAPRRS
ncbi:MAG: hypothetical protein ACFB6R_12815 [Alphaproteobacteria bacterium]